LAPILTIEKFSYAYPSIDISKEPQWVFQDLTLDVEEGEFVSVMGPTGVGKTTLCLALNGIVPQSTGGIIRGDIWVDGLNTKSHPISKLAQRVGMVFQDPDAQLFQVNVEAEVAFGLENLGVPRDEIRKRVDWALSVVHLQGFDLTPLSYLSGGQKQRVAIAAILAMRPKILVLDEPTTNLDPVGKEEILAGIKELRHNHGTTVIFVSHESEFIAELSDRVVILDQGQVAMAGSPESVFSQLRALHDIGVSAPQVTELADCLNREFGQGFSFCTLDLADRAIRSSLMAA